MRYKVPQNIDMQDRIVGPLTMLQFIYAVIGGGICYGIFSSGLPKILVILIDLPLALFIMALIFLKINERPFLDFVISVIQYQGAPKQRVWQHQVMPDLTVETYKPRVTVDKPVEQKILTPEDIANIAKTLDSK